MQESVFAVSPGSVSVRAVAVRGVSSDLCPCRDFLERAHARTVHGPRSTTRTLHEGIWLGTGVKAFVVMIPLKKNKTSYDCQNKSSHLYPAMQICQNPMSLVMVLITWESL